jgi:hypothetical protein
VKTRQLAATGLGLVATLTFAVAGCTGAADSPTVAPSASPGASETPSPGTAEAAAELSQAAAKLAADSFAMTTTFGPNGSVTGVMDPPNKLGKTTFKNTIQNTDVVIDSLLVGEDIYVKIAGLTGDLGTKWLHIDVQRLSADSNLGFTPGEFDPASSERLLKTAAEVRQVGDRDFVGTLDLTKATGIATIGDKVAVNLGDDAKNVPFEASTDEQGRLVLLKISLPAATGSPQRTIETRYSDFGTAVVVQRPPASDVIEAPDLVYKTLGTR